MRTADKLALDRFNGDDGCDRVCRRNADCPWTDTDLGRVAIRTRAHKKPNTHSLNRARDANTHRADWSRGVVVRLAIGPNDDAVADGAENQRLTEKLTPV